MFVSNNQSRRPRQAYVKPASQRSKVLPLMIVLAIFLGVLAWTLSDYHGHVAYSDIGSLIEGKKPAIQAVTVSPKQLASTASKVVLATTACSGNTLSQLVLVSISKRHLWACDQSSLLFNSPVITGMDFLAADLTPTGTYHVYAKYTNVVLRGSDSTGSWNDPVSYWMPFLDNQYGEYGFHDATWRAPNDFGNISPNSPDASHGCVECPLATAKWLYGWVQIGTTVTIES